MPRRTHKKSRAGCFECKKRHIKCDETHPKCVNCTTAGSKCSFETDEGPHSNTSLDAQQPLPAISVPQPPATLIQSTSSNIYTALPPVSYIPPGGSESGLNLEHLELLHHFLTHTHETFFDTETEQEVWRTVAIRHSLNFPFLCYQILAFSALHIAHLNLATAEHYKASATRLQSSAMNGFNTIQTSIDESSCAAVLLFSSLLALHVLADTARTEGLDSHGYVDHFISCIRLMRSVHGLVLDDFWPYLHSLPELKPLLALTGPEEPYNIPEPVRALQQLTESPDISDKTRSAYEKAIERLQWQYAVSKVPHQLYSTLRWLLAWPVQLTDEYIELLHQRQPRALIILSYYAVLLTFYRKAWVVGDKGIHLVRAISSHLGRYWDQWMRWPEEVIESIEREQSTAPAAPKLVPHPEMQMKG